MGPPDRPVVLRGATLFAAPFDLVGIAGAVAAVAIGIALASGPSAGPAGWALLVGSALVAGAGFAAARGCRVVLTDSEVRDQLAWRTRWSCQRQRITTMRVRGGAWRTFELVLDDDSLHVLRGLGPLQFPATLVPGATERDRHVIDTVMGPDDGHDPSSGRVSR